MTPHFAAYEAESLETYRSAGGDVSHVEYYTAPEEAQTRTKVPGAVAAYEWPAASSHPAKLAQFLLQFVVERGVRLFTFCPVTGVSRNSSSSSSSGVCLWDVHTPRGIVSTENVIRCTNAHAALLLPSLEPFITPNRAQAHSLIPTSHFSGKNILQNTFSLRYSLHHFYSLIQRQQDGTLVLGVSRSNPTLSQETIDGQISTDDTKYNEEIAQDALRNFGVIFPDSNVDIGSGAHMHGEGLDHVWTGIIAMTADSVPLVGEVEGLEGQFFCAGFNGHGKLSFSFPLPYS